MDILNLLPFIGLLALGRSLDLVSTWFASPDLALESNRWQRSLGWKKLVLINLLIVVLVPVLLGQQSALYFSIFSALLAARNFQYGWIARQLGAAEFKQLYRRYARTTPVWLLMLPIVGESIVWIGIGIVLLLIAQPRVLHLEDVGRAFIYFGGLVGLIMGTGTLRVRRAAKD